MRCFFFFKFFKTNYGWVYFGGYFRFFPKNYDIKPLIFKIINWRIIALQWYVSSAVQWSESAKYTHISSPRWTSLPPPTSLGRHRALTWDRCAMQQLPTSHLFCTCKPSILKEDYLLVLTILSFEIWNFSTYLDLSRSVLQNILTKYLQL